MGQIVLNDLYCKCMPQTNFLLCIQLKYKKYFRERTGMRTLSSLSTFLRYTYEFTLSLWYNCLVVIGGLSLAIVWGILNATVAFLQVWLIRPMLKLNLFCITSFFPIVIEPVSICIRDVCKAGRK